MYRPTARRVSGCLLALAIVVLLTAGMAPSRGVSNPNLADTIAAVAARHDAKLGVYVKHLVTGEEAALRADQRMRSASLYKLFVLYAAASQLQTGELALEQPLVFSPEALATEPYAEWRVGTRTSVGCALEAMITVSNNAAAAMLIERLGGADAVTTAMRQLGLRESLVTDEKATTSPRNIAMILEAIATDQAVSPEASREMRRLLLAQRHNDRLPLPLPLDVAVAHKTGELTRLRHDAGIVYAPSGPYLLVAMAEEAPTDAAARAAVVDLSAAVYDYFEPGGRPRALGLAPRLASEVFEVPDAIGRLSPLDDPGAQTVSLASAGVQLAPGVPEVTLRTEAVPDLAALQRAAMDMGVPFWVTGGYRGPVGGEWTQVRPPAMGVSCPVKEPEVTPPSDDASTVEFGTAGATQQWLGTVVTLAPVSPGAATPDLVASRAVERWLLEHSGTYGFVPALAESARGVVLGYEPGAWRWVGRELAGQLQTIPRDQDYTRVLRQELERAQRASRVDVLVPDGDAVQ